LDLSASSVNGLKAPVFDTHAYLKKLRSVGFTEEQAEVQARTLASLVSDQLATKRDLKELELKIERDLKEMELGLKHDLTLRLGGMLAASIATVAALVKLL
jgi:hypothetical protein